VSDDRHVLVTAGASGIGLSIAEVFLERGHPVTVCDVDGGALEQARERCPGLAIYRADVADAAAMNSLFAAIDPVLILVNNAGVAGPIGGIETNDPEAWARCFAVNVHGAFHTIRAAVPAMRAAGGGSIVNISTASTLTCPPGRASYIASKWALEGLTKSAARELGPDRIRVNAIRPGFMDTERMRGIMARGAEQRGIPVEELEREALSFISLRSKVQPREIGEMAYFLASDAALHVTGQIVGVDGNAEWEG
jgi:NAD(P)-dependent dehydrogenase (short-subunit alcohol dehydrogenase family)